MVTLNPLCFTEWHDEAPVWWAIDGTTRLSSHYERPLEKLCASEPEDNTVSRGFREVLGNAQEDTSGWPVWLSAVRPPAPTDTTLVCKKSSRTTEDVIQTVCIQFTALPLLCNIYTQYLYFCFICYKHNALFFKKDCVIFKVSVLNLVVHLAVNTGSK